MYKVLSAVTIYAQPEILENRSVSIQETYRDDLQLIVPEYNDTIAEGKDFHKLKNGLVFKVKEDSFVTSPIKGTVIYANKFRGYGNLVMIEDNNGFTCVLIGMKNLLISSGNDVLKGEPISKIFPEKRSQLYFELRQNGKVINPKSKVEIL